MSERDEEAAKVVMWAELVVAELRIDTERGEWDDLDKLEDAVRAYHTVYDASCR